MRKIFQKRRQILLPKPRAVEKDSVNLVFFGAKFDGFVPEDFYAQILQGRVSRKIRMADGAEVLTNDFVAKCWLVSGRGSHNLRNTLPSF